VQLYIIYFNIYTTLRVIAQFVTYKLDSVPIKMFLFVNLLLCLPSQKELKTTTTIITINRIATFSCFSLGTGAGQLAVTRSLDKLRVVIARHINRTIIGIIIFTSFVKSLKKWVKKVL